MVESRFSLSSFSQPAIRRSRNGTMKLDPPALLSTTSMWPSSSMALFTAALTSSCLVTSSGSTNALRPSAVICAAVWFRPSSLRAARATSAPAWASATAITCPIPREAPVTNAVRPVKSNTGLHFHSSSLPLGRQRYRCRRVDPAHDLVQHNTHVRLAHPEVPGTFDPDHH